MLQGLSLHFLKCIPAWYSDDSCNMCTYDLPNMYAHDQPLVLCGFGPC